MEETIVVGSGLSIIEVVKDIFLVFSLRLVECSILEIYEILIVGC